MKIRDWLAPYDAIVPLVLVALILALAACGTPAVQTRIQVEKIPVAVHTTDPKKVPTPIAPLPSPRPKNLSVDADILLSKWCEAVSYMLKADPLLRISAGETPIALAPYPECER